MVKTKHKFLPTWGHEGKESYLPNGTLNKLRISCQIKAFVLFKMARPWPFLKNGPCPPLFLYFRLFSTVDIKQTTAHRPYCEFSFFSNHIFTEKLRLQLDSNSDHPSRRRAHWPLDHQHHHHGPIKVFVYIVSEQIIKLIDRGLR